MIKINLLGTPKAKNKKGNVSAMPTMELKGGVSPVLKVAIVLVIVGGANFYIWQNLNKEKKSIDTQMAKAEQTNRELSDVKARYIERQRQADAYKKRVDVIDQLRSQQAGPVTLMQMIGDTVNGTEAVWLNNMKDTGTNVDIEGMALSTDAVANLIGNLQKTGFFNNIEIKETYQDDTFKEMQAFQFSLSCSKGPASTASSTTGKS
jgi:Tfp pilus assembly protein PilN